MNGGNRVALVTGSATGIGRSSAIKLAQRGYDVAVNYSRSEIEARETCHRIEQLGRRTLLCQCNVASDQAVRSMIDRVARELGGLHVLVNNAAITHFIAHTDLEAMTEEKWDDILAVNVKGAFFCSRAAVPLLRASGGGAIVNIVSVAGIAGPGSSIAYAASKGALITMTKSFAHAFAPEIRVNAVAPGPVDTRWLDDHRDMIQGYVQQTPLQRISAPDDIAAAVVFLALDAGMMTGQCLVVDGGRTM